MYRKKCIEKTIENLSVVIFVASHFTLQII